MVTKNLVAWQWSGYTRAHAARTNLVIHLVTAPMFVLGIVSAVALPWLGRPGLGALAFVIALGAFVAQGIGHRREHNAPEPFRSPLDVLARILVEQFVTFPRFVLSGGFTRAWRDSGRKS